MNPSVYLPHRNAERFRPGKEGYKMKIEHTEWASKHNWFISAGVVASQEGNTWGVLVIDSLTGDFVTITDYQKLREWVGY